ncbi:MAG: S-adenosylmethionine:tRNA ribosyltransferase-isomerase [Bacteroidia bacterium]|nr:S-adenosylmethionine:tRNA ribosyltransferase-isomerase [Bacteroidia bacterium]
MAQPYDISISEFNYQLPQNLVPAYPLERREDSKLLVYNGNTISQTHFKQIQKFLPENALLLFNNTRVISARLTFENEKQQEIEIFLLGPTDYSNTEPGTAMQAKGSVNWNCLVGNLKRWKEEQLVLKNNEVELTANIVTKNKTSIEIKFNWQPISFTFAEVIESLGQIPIPPYFERDSEASDKERYQTVYARHSGSVAAPTAGLHFTEELLLQLRAAGTKTLSLTLHVGAGTFKPVKSETLQGHDMHAEWMDIDLESILEIKNSLGKPIIAVGTTSLRALESIYWMGVKAYHQPHISLHALEIGQWEAYELGAKAIGAEESLQALISWLQQNGINKLTCRTQILIAPPYQLKLAKGIITNFHQPQSTLLLIVAAITGPNWRNIYDYALNNKFRFLSYGDCSLLLAKSND